MVTKTSLPTPGDVVLFEEDKGYSRDVVTIAAGADLQIGSVLGKITASSKYVLSAPGAVDGSQTPVAVLLEAAAAASADVENVLVIARHARVKRTGLVFDATIDTAPERQAAVDALKDVGILTDA